jgi:hypothetical protein
MRNFTFWKKSWRERGKKSKGSCLQPTFACNPPTLFYFGGGGLGLPKFHVLSFWNWLGIRNQLGSWVLKSSNNKEGRRTHIPIIITTTIITKERAIRKHTHFLLLGPIAQ